MTQAPLQAPLRVAFDVSCLLTHRPTGVGTYARQLFGAMAGLPLLHLHACVKAGRFRKAGMLQAHLPGVSPRLLWPGPWRGHRRVYHGPDFRLFASKGPARVVTVHDMAVYEPGLLDESFAARGRALLARTLLHQQPEAIIVVSNFTQNRLLAHFPELAPRVHRVYAGADHLGPAPALPLPPRPHTRPYVLWLGTFERRKNGPRAIEAFASIQAQFPQLDMLMAGSDGFAAQDTHAAVRKWGAHGRIFNLGYVDNATRQALLAHAEVFLYPSLYEGFGLPALEAQRWGIPVVAAAGTAVAEVAPHALLVDATEPEAIALGLRQPLENPSLRTEMAQTGRRHSENFTWAKCAAETLAVYEAALGRL